jgi:hypothetical protein
MQVTTIKAVSEHDENLHDAFNHKWQRWHFQINEEHEQHQPIDKTNMQSNKHK